jgi:lauroyl/myristoyl acyltransferase
MELESANGMKMDMGHLIGRIGLSHFLQWRFNTLLMNWLPIAVARAYISLMGKLYFALNRIEKQNIQFNLCAVIRRVPRTEPVDLVVRRTFQGLFAHYYEKLFTAYAHYDKVCRFILKRVEFEGQHLLNEALSQGRGVILVTGHFGAVEFLPTVLALNGYRVTMVVRFKTERLKLALNQRAARLGITLLDASEGDGVIFSACQALKANQILITECDEFEAWRPDRHRRTRFLDCSSPQDRSLDLLQRRHNSPAIMGLVCRSSGNRYGLKLHSLNATHHEPEAASISQRALRILEWYIYQAPDQWYQWKQVRIILGTEIFEEKRATLETETDRYLSLAD